MTWKTHIAGGVATGAAALVIFLNATGAVMVPECYINFIAMSGFAALLPDVDEIKSKIGKLLFPVSLIFFVMQVVIKILILLSFGKMRRRLKENTRFIMHRGICHYLITVGALAMLGYALIFFFLKCSAFLLFIMTAFVIGYLSHILLDLISGKIALFFPFSKKRIGIELFKYGGMAENIIALPALVMLSVYLIVKIVRL